MKEAVAVRKRDRKKKIVPEMLPKAEYLPTALAAAYLFINEGELTALAKEHGLTAAPLREGGKTLYYKVSELNGIFRKTALIK